MPTPARNPHTALAAALLLLAATRSSGADEVIDTPGPASGFLELESVLDGRCQILSDGGKLRVMHNRHAAATIEYRLLRTFAGKPQGPVTGTVAAAGEPVRLGCTRVDGRAQDWVVQRARFIDEDKP